MNIAILCVSTPQGRGSRCFHVQSTLGHKNNNKCIYIMYKAPWVCLYWVRLFMSKYIVLTRDAFLPLYNTHVTSKASQDCCCQPVLACWVGVAVDVATLLFCNCHRLKGASDSVNRWFDVLVPKFEFHKKWAFRKAWLKFLYLQKGVLDDIYDWCRTFTIRMYDFWFVIDNYSLLR